MALVVVGHTVMSRATRPASIARFRHEIARAHLDVFLVRADAPLDNQPLLRGARMNWFASVETRRPICIACKRSFTDDEVRPSTLHAFGGWLIAFCLLNAAAALIIAAMAGRN